MARSIIGVVVGALAWMFVFFFVAFLFALLWPAYGAMGRAWFEQGVFGFTAPMAVCNLIVWAVSAMAAGWVAMKISRNPRAVWTLAILIGLFLACIHLLLEWRTFPWWYNLGVVLPAIPAVLLGGRLGRQDSPR